MLIITCFCLLVINKKKKTLLIHFCDCTYVFDINIINIIVIIFYLYKLFIIYKVNRYIISYKCYETIFDFII